MFKKSKTELSPGIFVINLNYRDWGIGQIQSSIRNFVTINFENVGKKTINIEEVSLKIIKIK